MNERQTFWKKQRELTEAKWAAYDSKDYARADEIQSELDALVDPEPDEILSDGEGFFSHLTSRFTAKTPFGYCRKCGSNCYGDCEAN